MWKVFLIIAAVLLAGAGYFANSNRTTFGETKVALAGEQDKLAARLASIKTTEGQTSEIEQSIQLLADETQGLQNEKIDLDAKVVEAQSNLAAQEANLVSKREGHEKSRSLIGNLAQIEVIQKDMNQTRTMIEEAEIEVAKMEGAVASAQVEKDRLEKVAVELAALRADQAAGLIRGEFQSQILKAFNQWGFVIIEGGNDQGVVQRAQLDVYRRGQPICKLLITSVEPSQSVADVIPGSLVPGQSVQVGDTVVKTVRGDTSLPPAPAAVVGGGDPSVSPSAPPVPAGAPDPFGGSAPAPAPAAPDPFGGSAPAPAPATAPDPFGGSAPAPAPAPVPAPGPAPDPFQ
jgi:hypothetical protein